MEVKKKQMMIVMALTILYAAIYGAGWHAGERYPRILAQVPGLRATPATVYLDPLEKVW